VALAIAGVAAVLVLLAPALLDEADPLARSGRLLGGQFCHQGAERTIHLGGRPMAACARCSGLVFGGAGALLLLAGAPLLAGASRLVSARRRRGGGSPRGAQVRRGPGSGFRGARLRRALLGRRWLALALGVMVAHVAWGALGLADGGNAARFLTGALAAAALAPHLVEALAGMSPRPALRDLPEGRAR
jgi:uncharacterized membrane protein